MERFKAGSGSKGFKKTQGADYIAIGHSEQKASPRSLHATVPANDLEMQPP